MFENYKRTPWQPWSRETHCQYHRSLIEQVTREKKIGPASSTSLTVLRSDLLLCTDLASLLEYRESEKKRSIDLAWHSDCGPERGQEKIRFNTSLRCTKTSRKRIESTVAWVYFFFFNCPYSPFSCYINQNPTAKYKTESAHSSQQHSKNLKFFRWRQTSAKTFTVHYTLNENTAFCIFVLFSFTF